MAAMADLIGPLVVFVSCVGAMPSDSSMYYGFTRFAMELNEIDSEQRHLYAPTDTRFRPDQRSSLAQLQLSSQDVLLLLLLVLEIV